MNKVLLVDDDPIVLKIYQDGLAKEGLTVESAPDGLEAVKKLRSSKPDLVVLDLMMPKFSGVDVLKFMRGQKDLAALPVVVLSNAYMGDLARGAIALGVQKALLKVRCTPAGMAGVIREILAGKTAFEDPAQWPAVTAEEQEAPPLPPSPLPPPKAPHYEEADAGVAQARRRAEFLQHAPAILTDLHKLFDALVEAATESQRQVRLQDLYRKITFITAAAGMAGLDHIAQLTSAFEALLFDLMAKPHLFSSSVRQTMAAAADFLRVLFERAGESSAKSSIPNVLVVDDDAVSNRLVIAALHNAHMRARSAEDPMTALQLLVQNRYDLILLDVELPEVRGFELCKKLRTLPNYLTTPVIYVTLHDDFESRAQSVLSGGDDLISKPVLPLELAVKVVMHLLRSRLGKGH